MVLLKVSVLSFTAHTLASLAFVGVGFVLAYGK
jgi:hypothetical protein